MQQDHCTPPSAPHLCEHRDARCEAVDPLPASQVGMVRDMQFVTAVKSKMGPDKTLCVQTQRFVVYSGQRLLFQTSQTMNDIPYSDHFTVRPPMRVRWLAREGRLVRGRRRSPFGGTLFRHAAGVAGAGAATHARMHCCTHSSKIARPRTV